MSSNQRTSPRVFCIPFSHRRAGLCFYAPDIPYTLRPSWFMLAVLQHPWALCVEFSRAVSVSVRSHTPVYISRGLAVCWARVKKDFFPQAAWLFSFFFLFFSDVDRPLPHLHSPSSTLQWVARMPVMALGAKMKKKKENGEGTSRRARERAGRETGLIIQIQSLKGKCVFQAVKMINGWEQILTNALV